MTHQHANYKQIREQYKQMPSKMPWKALSLAILGSFLLIAGCRVCHAKETPDIERLTRAIYLAEGGNRTKHPYGILKRYKATTPKQACINTIKSALKRWNGQGDFIVYLGRTYCPVGASNDPKGLNKNWVKNVKYYYERGKS